MVRTSWTDSNRISVPTLLVIIYYQSKNSDVIDSFLMHFNVIPAEIIPFLSSGNETRGSNPPIWREPVLCIDINFCDKFIFQGHTFPGVYIVHSDHSPQLQLRDTFFPLVYLHAMQFITQKDAILTHFMQYSPFP